MPPTPKPAHQRQRRHRITSAATVEARSAIQPDLKKLLRGRRLHPMADWTWQTWWASPLTAEWVDADVPDLVDLVLLVDAFWKGEDLDRPKLHAEIRMAMREFGLTPMSRRSLQWEIKRVEGGQPQPAPQRRRRTGKPSLQVLTGKVASS